MKKIISLILAVVIACSLLSFASCSKAEPLKFGVGIIANYAKATDADGDTNGAGQVDATVATVLLDKDGKIVKCALDAVQNKVAWTSKGELVDAGEFKTKYELGTDYGMAAYGTDLNGDGVVKEWNEQADIFVESVIGKTVDEVKALVVEGYGTEEVQTAGCTMAIADYVTAVEKAVANAVESEATAEDTLKIGVVSSAGHDNKAASDDGDGLFQVDTHFAVAVTNAEGKVVVAKTDALQAKFTFDAKGKSTLDTKTEIKTKYELGTDYGMAAYGTDLNGDGVVKEWNEQADAFNAAIVGKTADEIAGLVVKGYGTDEVQTAGCTMAISDMVAAAVKAATVA